MSSRERDLSHSFDENRQRGSIPTVAEKIYPNSRRCAPLRVGLGGTTPPTPRTAIYIRWRSSALIPLRGAFPSLPSLTTGLRPMSELSLGGVPDRPAPCIRCYISLRIPPSLDLEQGTIVTATQPRISEHLLGPVILPPDESLDPRKSLNRSYSVDSPLLPTLLFGPRFVVRWTVHRDADTSLSGHFLPSPSNLHLVGAPLMF